MYRCKPILIFLLCIGINSTLQSQVSGNEAELYIQKYKEYAIVEMQRSRIPASITLAQGIYESQSGKSRLAVQGNNHFGIKCKSTWNGPVIYEDDDDYQECFRAYEDPYYSYRDHTNFLLAGMRYAFLFDLEPTDYKGWAWGLKEAGYATNPEYANKIIELIERYGLAEYDKVKKVTMKVEDEPKSPVIETNGIPSVKAREDDSYARIAVENKVSVSQLFEYNDLTNKSRIKYGDIIYLKEKKTSTNKAETHIVERGQSVYDIAQMYGIKLSLLLERNGLEPGEEPSTGETLSLNKKNKNAVKKRKILGDGTKAVDMRIHMGERDFEKDKEDSARRAAMARNGDYIDDAIENVQDNSKVVYTGNKREEEDNKDAETRNASKQQAEKNSSQVNQQTNSTDQVYHIVQKGETLYSISKQYNVKLDDLMAWNDLSAGLKAGAKLLVAGKPSTAVANQNSSNEYLPGSDKQVISASSESKPEVINEPTKVYPASTDPNYYMVQNGETPDYLASKFGLTIYQLLYINGLSSADNIKPGVRLRIKPSNTAEAKPTNIPSFHVVRKGDTLYSISKRYGIGEDEIRKINVMTSDELKVGMKLLLY